jgi:hypothetical protein
MTQPTGADIRAACEEAGVKIYHYQHHDTLFAMAIDALARRIAAEREAVPVGCARRALLNIAWPMNEVGAWTQAVDSAAVRQLEARLAAIEETDNG